MTSVEWPLFLIKEGYSKVIFIRRYITHEILHDDQATLLVSPSVSQLITVGECMFRRNAILVTVTTAKQCTLRFSTDTNSLPPTVPNDVVEGLLAPLELSNRRLIMFAVNDSTSTTIGASGSHWSVAN